MFFIIANSVLAGFFIGRYATLVLVFKDLAGGRFKKDAYKNAWKQMWKLG
jgi:hypothetical protein